MPRPRTIYGWHLGPMCGFDLESTGVDVETARIVTACIALIDGTGKTPPETIESVIDPGIPIPEGAAAIHGWTTERMAAAPEAVRPAAHGVEFVAEMLAKALRHGPGAPLIGHNISYDLTLLDRELRRHGLDLLHMRLEGAPLHVVDTMVLCRRSTGKLFGHKLHECAAKQGLPWDEEQAHGSTYDAVQSARIAWTMADQDPRLAAVPLAELHARQVEWKRAQDVEMAAFFRRKGRSFDGPTGHWPVVPYGAGQERAS